MRSKLLPIIFLMALLPQLIFAQCMTYPVSLTNRIQLSTAIIEGKVVSRNSFFDAGQNLIFTSNIIEVYKVFKGNVTANQVELITEGGIVGTTMQKTEPSLNFEINDVGVFFGVAATNSNSFSPFPASHQFESVAANQGFIKYDLRSLTGNDPYNVYSDITVDVYQFIVNQTGNTFTELIPFNLFPSQNLGPGNPAPQVFPTITAITSPSTAGTFSTVTVTGNNFGAGPFGGTRMLEFRDANNGGAGFIPTPPGHIISWTNTSIQAWVPSGAGSGTIRVTNNLSESTISGVSITINYNETNVNTGTSSYQPDLINDNGTGGYTFLYNNTFNGNAAAVAAFERALQTWRCGTYVNFNRVGTTATACQAMDGNNIVTFDGSCALPAGVLGVSYSYYSSCGSGIWFLNENDLKFRTNGTGGINWNYGPAPTAGGLFDFESVALHELGHSHQLGHTITPVTVMNYAVGPNTDRRTLTAVSETAGGNDIMSRSVVTNSCGPAAMIALNSSNCSIAAPVANFSGTPLSGCNNINVTFTDLSTGSPLTWTWSFPGGTPNNFSGQNPPPINYSAPGTYSVTLTVTNLSGSDAETKTNYITVNNCPPPVADFSATPLTVCAGQTVSFTDLSTNTPTSWSWTFTGGTPGTSTVPNPIITYNTPGVYDVTLIATNPYGSGTITKTAYITVNACPPPPVVNFSASPTTLCAGGTVAFTDLSTNSPFYWQWSFPGGTPATSLAQNPVITYSTAGTYNVTLLATNSGGTSSATFNAYITVNICSAPTANFAGWPTTICAGQQVNFSDLSTNSPTSWSWTFTGGAPAASGVQNPLVTYAVPGVYNVSLQATNGFGSNTNTKNGYITVTACPAVGSGLIVNDGSLIFVQPTGLITIQGGFINRDNGANIGNIDNRGLITLTGDWTNNSVSPAYINSSPGTCELLGAAQLITGTTTTNFYNLTCLGTGIKTLTVNTIVEGTLALNDRELATQSYWMHVTNPSVNAITRTGGYIASPVQGFVSGTTTGRLRRNTNSTGAYLFPVGSSVISPRYRPVVLTPSNGAANTYAVRFVNNNPTIDGYSIFLKDASLGNINPYWYQKINSISGTTQPDITLYFDNLIDNIPALPSLLMAQWAYNAPPVQWRDLNAILINGVASPNLSSATKAAWVSFDTENFNLAPQSIPLPIELLSFTGECVSDDITLQWQTASEINNDFFTIEKSDDGKYFSVIGRIEGAGTTSNLSQYEFTDTDADLNNISYYRLRQTDYNGEESVSDVIAVNCKNHNGPGAVSIFPNPVNEELNILFNQSNKVEASVKIYDMLGRIVFERDFNLTPGLQTFRLNIGFLAPSLYQVSIDYGLNSFSEKIIRK